ncbi:hypothetical protein TNCV_290351 [Trichonephila clavipes]|nr:hypothetical protein TNCV_290351 [Trichonephila clavipes]
MPAVSTLSSSTQAHLLSSTSAVIPTIQSESLLPIPVPTTTSSSGNNLNTSASSLETETRLLTTSNKFSALSTEIQPLVPLPESVSTTSNSELILILLTSQSVENVIQKIEERAQKYRNQKLK